MGTWRHHSLSLSTTLDEQLLFEWIHLGTVQLPQDLSSRSSSFSCCPFFHLFQIRITEYISFDPNRIISYYQERIEGDLRPREMNAIRDRLLEKSLRWGKMRRKLIGNRKERRERMAFLSIWRHCVTVKTIIVTLVVSSQVELSAKVYHSCRLLEIIIRKIENEERKRVE